MSFLLILYATKYFVKTKKTPLNIIFSEVFVLSYN